MGRENVRPSAGHDRAGSIRSFPSYGELAIKLCRTITDIVAGHRQGEQGMTEAATINTWSDHAVSHPSHTRCPLLRARCHWSSGLSLAAGRAHASHARLHLRWHGRTRHQHWMIEKIFEAKRGIGGRKSQKILMTLCDPQSFVG